MCVPFAPSLLLLLFLKPYVVLESASFTALCWQLKWRQLQESRTRYFLDRYTRSFIWKCSRNMLSWCLAMPAAEFLALGKNSVWSRNGEKGKRLLSIVLVCKILFAPLCMCTLRHFAIFGYQRVCWHSHRCWNWRRLLLISEID